MKKLRVAELFAGVGGFRLGLEQAEGYKIVWSNQWEPSTKKQHASMVYEAKFGKENHSNKNIEEVETKDIPDHDILVGGFPCQDYSVATTLTNSKGLEGKKGVLWWSIYRILKEKKKKPNYLFLENVDRLLKSPVNQRGRDFAIMLECLNELGYAVEWRVINAADYGMPQRRRRVFFLGYRKGTTCYKQIKKDRNEWLMNDGVVADVFPINQTVEFEDELELFGDKVKTTNEFNKHGSKSLFQNTGLMVNGKVITFKSKPTYTGKRTLLGQILQSDKVPADLYIADKDHDRWNYLKGAKKETRTSKSGYNYQYTEGKMSFPDALDKPSRTVITGEGGRSPSRFKHVVATKKGLRRLSPIELERLNMFPDNHTDLEGISDTKRAFFMGNALVVGIVQRIGRSLRERIDS